MSDVSVEEATDVTPALLDAINRLVPQLSGSAEPLGERELAGSMSRYVLEGLEQAPASH